MADSDAIIAQIPTRHYITIEKKQIMSTSNIISIAISSMDKESGWGGAALCGCDRSRTSVTSHMHTT